MRTPEEVATWRHALPFWVTFLLVPILWFAAMSALSPAPRDDDISKLRELVIPATAERWETIPWRTDLAAARVDARREGRLLFLWAMNGHPCGST